MASLLKNIYSAQFYSEISSVFSSILPNFNERKFSNDIFSPDFEQKELKERMRHTATVLHQFLPEDYVETVQLLKQAIGLFRERGNAEDGLAYMFLPDYIESYGLENYETSIDALEFITQFVSCEFAVRPFLLKYTEPMLRQMALWAMHPNYKVRRLASEGSRPRLPWAMAVPALKKDAFLVIPILEKLKNDPSEWVRRSVANNLNDIAKDHPQIVLDLAKQWTGIGKETDAIIKHGSRTLLKQGDPEILKYYQLESDAIEVNNLEVVNPYVKIGENLEFNFNLSNKQDREQKIRLEYAIYYRKQNGQLSKKVFKISEKGYPEKTTIKVHRKQKFILITTRTFYTGSHDLSIIVNGEEKAKTSFELCSH
ncbi:DNA alkylation repair protein [Pedobacter sp. MC2016-24]|uniref:DNA alkylation repair protein n=1 Tax=Pedobacter sp. MC2016-24 TaxID=2780090 RepID=UPI0018805289|nr:DNA alkylation repair protein [Pedobacter sp. MC2016-24]MBE9600852.1 DNA alkylation repair protein [Pedobacter sp. MC2016-24]